MGWGLSHGNFFFGKKHGNIQMEVDGVWCF